MDDNEKFISKWKPIHDKTMFKYVIRDSLICLLILILATIIILWIDPLSSSVNGLADGRAGMNGFILSNVSLFLAFTLGRAVKWFRGERRFKKIVNKEY